MLQSPSTNTGRYLTGSDDLNTTAWQSGLYTVSIGAYGQPANTPIPGFDGHVWIHTEDPTQEISITQIFYPAAAGGGDALGNGGYPPYWREWNSNIDGNDQPGWTNWFPFVVQGKQGFSQGVLATFVGGYSFGTGLTTQLPEGGTWVYWGGNSVSGQDFTPNYGLVPQYQTGAAVVFAYVPGGTTIQDAGFIIALRIA